jgi:hypothetical protein
LLFGQKFEKKVKRKWTKGVLKKQGTQKDTKGKSSLKTAQQQQT